MVSVSFSCNEDNFKKIMNMKEAIEADRMKTVPLSAVVNSLVRLGFAYRELMKLDKAGKGKQLNLEAEEL